MDLSAPRRRAGANDRIGAKIFRRRPFGATRAQASRARTAPRPSQRLAVHTPHRHKSRLRPPPCQRPPASLRRPARTTHHHPRGRKVARASRVAGQHFPRGGLPVLGLSENGNRGDNSPRSAEAALPSPSPPRKRRRGRGEEAVFRQFPLSPALSPLVPRGERGKNPSVFSCRTILASRLP